MTRPLVAVVATYLAPGRVDRWRFGGYGVGERYVEALWRAGAQPVLVPALGDTPDAGRFDALVLMGGGDVDPVHYGAERHGLIYGIEPVRDAVEVGLVASALERAVPTLAVCRGIQVVNVSRGGTLHQHLPEVSGTFEHAVKWSEPSQVHDVRLTAGSRVAQACGADVVSVASRHHQAVDAVGDGLVVTGVSPDGVIEAIEFADPSPWFVGVQWHPEETAADDPAQQALFDALVAAV